MNQPLFVYNQEQGVKAGQGAFINETGAYVGRITAAKWTQSQGGAKALELSFEDENGLKADYLSIYYTSKNGDPMPYGQNMIHAIMGCTSVKQLTQTLYNGNHIAPELTDKRIGLMLQKTLRLKQDGSETHSFSVVCPFSASSRKTLAEHAENRPAERIDWLVANIKDKDERNKSAHSQSQVYAAQHQYYASTQPTNNNGWDGYTDQERQAISQQQPPVADFDDDIPF